MNHCLDILTRGNLASNYIRLGLIVAFHVRQPTFGAIKRPDAPLFYDGESIPSIERIIHISVVSLVSSFLSLYTYLNQFR